jgi:hypothetical protein
MAYNPNLPANNSPVSSTELRAQFNGLKDLCDNLQTEFDNTALSTNNVQPLSLTVSNPPTQAQVQAIANKIDEMLAAMQH